MTRRSRDPFAGSTPRTVGGWLTAAERAYAKSKVALGQVATNAHDEALYLLLRTLDLPLESDASVLSRRVDAAAAARVREVFTRRLVDRVPAAYLTREAWLGEHRFYVDERVIIPRSYFLEIIPSQLASWLPADRKIRHVIDVCTGSGCLAVLLAHQFPAAKVDACDLSPDALAVAEINVRAHGLAQRISLHRSDVLSSVPPVKYDVILSNPPYEPSSLVDTQDPEFAAEPRMAHDGGRDGLDIVRRLLRQARDRLAPHGIVVIEVGGLHAVINREFAALDPHWLRTEDGSDCVVLFQAHRLMRAGV
jgi:ribosomal protein L3 glutamine methyltransferase